MFKREVLKSDLGENSMTAGWGKVSIWEHFQSLLKVVGSLLRDSTLGPNGGVMKIF